MAYGLPSLTLKDAPRGKIVSPGGLWSGGVCELNVYPGVGHLLTRNLANQVSDFDPHPEFRADGKARHERFLRDRGFISVKAK